MKRLLVGFLLLAAFSCKTTKELKAPAKILEEGYEIKMLFKPNSKYVTELEQVTNSIMTMPGTPGQNMINSVSAASTMTFGPLINNQSEMLLVYDKMDVEFSGMGSDQMDTPNLVGMKLYGKLTEGIQSIDSIVGGEESMHNMMESLLEPMFSNMQIDFPNPMKIGEHFIDTKTITIPIEEMGSTTVITDTKYTLIKVTNNIAEITTDLTLSGNLSMMGNEFPLKGSGSGIVSIDLEQQYSVSSSVVIDQVMNIEMQGMTMDQKTSVSLDTKTQKVR